MKADAANPAEQWRTALALFCASTAVTLYQLTLMQLFSYVQWYHFAYMMVSLALLGFGASGTVLTFFRQAFHRHSQALIWTALVLASAGMPGILLLLHQEWLQFDLYLLFVGNAQLGRFALAVFLLFLPFLCSAIAIGGILTLRASQAPRFYFADLLGSAAGGLFGIFLTSTLMPGEGATVCGLVALTGAVIFGIRQQNRLQWTGNSIILLLLMLFFSLAPDWEPSQFKSLSRVLDMPDARVLEKTPDVRGVIHKVRAPTLHTAPGLSLAYSGDIPSGETVFVDGARYGAYQEFGDPASYWEQATTEALAYTLNPSPDSVLLLATDGLSALRLAESQDAGEAQAVEPHPRIAGWTREALSEAGLNKRGWSVQKLSPRAALEQEAEPFDLIRYPTVGNFHGGVGLQALGAEFLLTRESFAKAIERLSSDGVLVITCWLDFPERKPLRLLNTLLAGARDAGMLEPGKHLAILRSWGAISFLLKAEPLTPKEEKSLLADSEKWNFDPLWLGQMDELPRERYHELESRTLFRMTDALLKGDSEKTWKNYPFAIDASSDDRPFFSQFLRPRSLDAMHKAFGERSMPFFELGTFILFITLLLLLFFAAAFILLPLPFRRLKSAGKSCTVLYFASLGLGFLFVEIIFMQVYHMVWGSPVLAAGGTIGGMLLFSGLGALSSQAINPNGRIPIYLAAGVCLLLLAASTLFLPLARSMAGMAPFWRYFTALLTLALVSYPLGFFFPTGLRLLKTARPDHLPWAWGINGSFSVISPPLALLACILGGFSFTFLLAALFYAIAGATLQGLRH
ncbi:MAG: hypothetical protein ACLFS4_04355 [Opitutales bacterium]